MRFKKTLKHFSNQNKQGQVTTNAYIGRNANVRLTNYLDNAPPMTQPNDESTVNYKDGNEEDEEFYNVFQDTSGNHSDDSSATYNSASDHVSKKPANPITNLGMSYRDHIPPSLRKPYRDPRILRDNRRAPLPKTPPTNSIKALFTEITPNTSNKVNYNSSPKPLNQFGDEANPNQIKTTTLKRDLFTLKFKPAKIYTSPYLDDVYKPQANSIKLNSELEPLHPLIMSQHEVFTQHIIDLSNTNLTLTKTIEKKRNSYNQLKDNKKIPRSLQLKVELTTSPSHTSNQDFVKLKEKLQMEVTSFIEKSTKIMTDWALIYLKLLIDERCSKILHNAVQILNGLSSFYAEMIGWPEWPSIKKDNTTLFLLKLYLSDSYLQVKDLEEFLEIPLNEILLKGTKLFLDTETDEEANNILESMDLSNFDPSNELQNTFVSETLISFDQILKVSLLDIWRFNREKLKQTAAAQNLKFAMKSLQTNETTTSTASAINRAIENLKKSNSTDLKTALRLSNLERTVRKNEQKSNEFLKKISIANKVQKNSQGSHTLEHMASPHRQAPPKKGLKRKQKLVDLTLEDDSEESTDHGMKYNHFHMARNSETKKKLRNTFPPPPKKTIQWSGTETRSFNPNQPVNTNLPTPFAHSPLPLFGHAWNPPCFPPAPPLAPPIQQSNLTTNYQYPANFTGLPQTQYQQQGLNQNPFYLQNHRSSNTATQNNPFHN